MKRRDFVGLTGIGAVGACLGTSACLEPSESGAESTADQTDPRFQEIASLVEAKMTEYRVPGVALAVLKDGQASLLGLGITNLDDPQPVTPDTVFPIASISKTVAAVAMLRLADEGRVALDDAVTEYLPDFRLRDRATSSLVTIRHLLTHTPGWDGDLPVEDHGIGTHERFVAGMADVPFLARPGEVWGYNNAGFSVAARIIEVVTESSIHDAFADLVFLPLGLSRAFTKTGDAMLHRFAAPHSEVGGATRVLRPFELPVGTASGGAAMSLESLASYAAFHLGDGTGPAGERILSRESLELMRTPQLTKRPLTEEMGAGLHLRRLGGVQTAVQCGQLFGHCLHFQLVPERDLAFAILTNHMQGWRLHSDVERAILELYEGLSLSPNQAIGGDRGTLESVAAHATPLSPQPPPDEYLGTFRRLPSEDHITITTRNGRLTATIAYLGRETDVPITFWGEDRAYVDPDEPIGYDVLYPYRGAPIEFIRDETGEVRWSRYGGRFGRRT